MSDVDIQLCDSKEIIVEPNFDALCAEYRAEFGADLWGPHKVDLDRYTKDCAILSVRCDGTLVGFGVVRPVRGMAHFKDTVTASVDAVFILRRYRKGPAGLRLLRRMADVARTQYGAGTLVITAPYGSRLARLLRAILRGNPVSEVFVMPTGRD